MENFRSSLEARQLDRLRNLLTAVTHSNNFYKHHLAGSGIEAELSNLTFESFTQLVPLTTKADISKDQAENQPFGTNLTFPTSHYTRFHQTSGSTGKPIRWLDTPEDWQSMLESWKQVFLAADVHKGSRTFFAFSFGPFLGFWTAFEAAQQLSLLCIPGGGLSSQARIKAIIESQAEVICCTPTYAIHLGQSMADAPDAPLTSSIQKIIVAGEPGGSIPAIRERITSLWNGAQVYDHHGMTEVGPVTFPCPNLPDTLRVYEENYLVEILDPESLKPVPFGETGELILTTLTRVGSPLIRYRTGDLVRTLSPEDRLENYLGLAGGIIGRSDDMIIVRGVNLFPSAIESVLRQFDQIAEYQVIIDESSAMTQIAVEIELNPDIPATLASSPSHFEEALKKAFNLRIPVAFAPTGSLPRFEMKSKRWKKIKNSNPQ